MQDIFCQSHQPAYKLTRMLTPLDSTTQQFLNQRQNYRAMESVRSICSFLFPFFFILTGVDWISEGIVRVGIPWTPLGNLLGAIGCGASAFLNRSNKDSTQSYPIVWPVFLGLWISTLPIIALTGGAHSVFCGESLCLLFLIGIIAQNTISWKSTFAFCLSNWVFWLWASQSKSNPELNVVSSSHSISQTYFWLQNIQYLGCMAIALVTFTQATKKTDQTSALQDFKLKEAQNHLTHTVKLAEAGDLLATTAHELAQPVQVISISSALLHEFIISGIGTKEAQKKLVSKINEASGRLTRLLTQLRNYARKEPFQTQLLDLREAIHTVQLLTEHDLRTRNISFEFSAPNEPIWIQGDLSRIQQVMLNLINNARDACSTSSKPFVKVSVEKFKTYARISVVNNGPGIPCEIQNKLFHPYFTTKDRGKGTGLGLTISADIIDHHHGRLFFSSEPEYTVFCIDFKRLEEDQLAMQTRPVA